MRFDWPVRIYWEDTDAGGVVFYANYLKFFERARTEWLRARGLGQQQLRDTTGGMFVASSAQLRWLQPARLDDALRITAHVRHVGRATLTLTQQALLDNIAAPVLCEGHIRLGWVDATSLRPARIPDTVLAALTAPIASTAP